ncbi:hypothetical protein BpHYR1_051817 [Brachionus plicatilis]|uniref:Uncharacterized protein n=1 Tax=Brachionus plicatilis TaxID=10195 RepID=A0A3M7P5P8_BRAPC|nr:hypothetical protein BpHYR1_051817 [Brachionus plicatilis]
MLIDSFTNQNHWLVASYSLSLSSWHTSHFHSSYNFFSWYDFVPSDDFLSWHNFVPSSNCFSWHNFLNRLNFLHSLLDFNSDRLAANNWLAAQDLFALQSNRIFIPFILDEFLEVKAADMQPITKLIEKFTSRNCFIVGFEEISRQESDSFYFVLVCWFRLNDVLKRFLNVLKKLTLFKTEFPPAWFAANKCRAIKKKLVDFIVTSKFVPAAENKRKLTFWIRNRDNL